jgi:hypothetical protein
MNLEDELRAALRREDPSLGFAKRVAARAQSSGAPRQTMPRFIWAVAIAAMLVIGLTATYEVRQMKAERAGREAVMALRIAADKLNSVREKVVRREN